MKPGAAVLACLLFVGCDRKPDSGAAALAELGKPGQYQLILGGDNRVWKLDTVTGTVWTCWPGMLPQAAGCSLVPFVTFERPAPNR